MKPYYESGGITIYHGDCREVLPTLGPVDLVFTDPPYGIGMDGSNESIQHGWQVRKGYEWRGWDKSTPDDELLRLVFDAAPALVCFGANYFNHMLPAGKKGWVVWDKAQRGLTMSDCEIVFTSLSVPTRIITCHRTHLWNEGPEHPTQKPLRLVKTLLEMFPNEETVLDPFMGSGTTLRAAKDLGRKAIGIEIEERYCEIAVKRLAQEVLL
jgi:DNA modification methylase